MQMILHSCLFDGGVAIGATAGTAIHLASWLYASLVSGPLGMLGPFKVEIAARLPVV